MLASSSRAAARRPTREAPPVLAGSASESVPGVIDCGKSLSKLEVRPTSLPLVCSDGTAGLENLTWSHWGRNITTSSPGQAIPSATATGTGEFVLNDCKPNCADDLRHVAVSLCSTQGYRRPRSPAAPGTT
jgi:hypothetical protein